MMIPAWPSGHMPRTGVPFDHMLLLLHMFNLSTDAKALYLFYILMSDLDKGFYEEAPDFICRFLKLSPQQVVQAQECLHKAELIDVVRLLPDHFRSVVEDHFIILGADGRKLDDLVVIPPVWKLIAVMFEAESMPWGVRAEIFMYQVHQGGSERRGGVPFVAPVRYYIGKPIVPVAMDVEDMSDEYLSVEEWEM